MKLRKIYVEITNDCNLSCSFCAKSKRRPRYMNLCEFRHIAAQISGVTQRVYLHVLGEPLMHPELGGILDICAAKGLMANITTNSTLLSIRQDALLNKSLAQINYSLHSLKELEDSGDIRERIVSAVRSFTVERPDLHHNIRLWTGADRQLIGIIERIFGMTADMSLPKQELDQNVKLHISEEFAWPKSGGPEIFTSGRCLALRHDAAILSDGTVTACCLDYDGELALGNIFERDIKSILASDRAGRIKDGFGRGMVTEDFCRTCGFAARTT